ncbi:MAG: hypothetical protein L0Y58_17890, partial [Verrucomicrobia subdivision 3 bacterium]|nr:hypothetical protein [Limisphaerales bacterium]
AAAGVSEEERKRARLSDRPVVSLTRPTPPYNRTGIHRAVTSFSRLASGGRVSQWSGGWNGAHSGTHRSATPVAEPQTEARRACGTSLMPARDERTVCEVERVRSRGGRGRTGNP